MKTITTAQVLEAFRNHPHVRPAEGRFLVRGEAGSVEACCGLTIQCLDRPDVMEHMAWPTGLVSRHVTLRDALGLDNDYAQGFIQGWDSELVTRTASGLGRPAYYHGFDDGMAARIAVFEDYEARSQRHPSPPTGDTP